MLCGQLDRGGSFLKAGRPLGGSEHVSGALVWQLQKQRAVRPHASGGHSQKAGPQGGLGHPSMDGGRAGEGQGCSLQSGFTRASSPRALDVQRCLSRGRNLGQSPTSEKQSGFPEPVESCRHVKAQGCPTPALPRLGG